MEITFGGCAATQTRHTNCPGKAAWWNFIRISSPARILSLNQNKLRGAASDPRLHSLNLGKVYKTASNESSCALDFESLEASCCSDKAASESRRAHTHAHTQHAWSIIEQILLLCLCVWFTLADQACLFQSCGLSLFFISLARCERRSWVEGRSRLHSRHRKNKKVKPRGRNKLEEKEENKQQERESNDGRRTCE